METTNYYLEGLEHEQAVRCPNCSEPVVVRTPRDSCYVPSGRCKWCRSLVLQGHNEFIAVAPGDIMNAQPNTASS